MRLDCIQCDLEKEGALAWKGSGELNNVQCGTRDQVISGIDQATALTGAVKVAEIRVYIFRFQNLVKSNQT